MIEESEIEAIIDELESEKPDDWKETGHGFEYCDGLIDGLNKALQELEFLVEQE